MINIRRLKRPTKKSGIRLPPGYDTTIKGVLISNKNDFSIWIDKFTPYHQRAKRKKNGKKKAVVK